MRRFTVTLIILLAICAAFFYALSTPRGMGDIHAVEGVLDLTYADFTTTRHNLDGEWEFYFGELLTPEDFANAGRSGGRNAFIPFYPINGQAEIIIQASNYS